MELQWAVPMDVSTAANWAIQMDVHLVVQTVFPAAGMMAVLKDMRITALSA
jgi:hypothetical protein